MKKSFAASLLAVVALGLLAGCGKPAEPAKKPAVPQAKTLEPALKTDWPQDAMLDAVLRGHPRAKRVCQDETRVNAFFADYSQYQDDGDVGLFNRGWVLIDKVEFYETSNKTLFITDLDYGRYIRVYPDVSGLKCKER